MAPVVKLRDDITLDMYIVALETCLVAEKWDTMATIDIRKRYSALSIVSALTALESYINRFAKDNIPQFYDEIEQLRLVDKWYVAPHLVSGRTFEKGAQPLQDFSQVIRIRNQVVHPKPKNFDWDEDNEHRPWPPSARILTAENSRLACSLIPRMIGELHDMVGTDPPNWIRSKGDELHLIAWDWDTS